MVDKIKHIFILQNQCLNINKLTVYNIYRLTWAHMHLWTHGNCPTCPCVKTALSPSSVLSLITAELVSRHDIAEKLLNWR